MLPCSLQSKEKMDLPPSYDEAVGLSKSYASVVVPPRYGAATEGRNSIRYSQLPPVFDTTRLYLIDNKSSDISNLNYQNDHSNFLTTVVQNSDYTAKEACNQTINLDDRSRWGGELRTLLHTNMPNVNEFMYSNSFRVLVPATADATGNILTYAWRTLTLPEGNYSEAMVVDLMNNAIVEDYLANGRQNNVKEEDIGVKIDTRNFMLGYDPVKKLIMPGVYTNEAFHPDIVLAPGCAIDFTQSRLSNLLGIRKRQPFQEGFVIDYESLVGGDIPALLDLTQYSATPQVITPLLQDSKGRSYHVNKETLKTWYRSWYVAYNYSPNSPARSNTLLVTPDVTCGVEQIYWSLPDLFNAPVTFRDSQNTSQFPVVATEILPLMPRSYYNAAAVYSQMLQDSASNTFVFNRFPENQIWRRPPAPTIMTICENVPSHSNHGILPMRNSISGVQRVTVTDARRRTLPYVYKSLGTVTPSVLSSKTF